MNPAESEEAFCALRPADRRPFCEIALVEMTSVMRYYLAGHVFPWCDLSADARRRHVVSDAAAYLANVEAPAWKAHLHKYGWQELSQPDTALRSEGIMGIPASPARQELLQECARGLQHSGMSWVIHSCHPCLNILIILILRQQHPASRSQGVQRGLSFVRASGSWSRMKSMKSTASPLVFVGQRWLGWFCVAAWIQGLSLAPISPSHKC